MWKSLTGKNGKILTVTSKVKLGFSKDFDGLPIVQTTISSEVPCADPSRTSFSKDAKFYPTEYTQFFDCKQQPQSGLRLDTRYQKAGDFSVSAYDLQAVNGVIS
jgi:hypothetical protein